jgi:guanylate kinase
MSQKNTVFILSGPAWAGKNTIWDLTLPECRDHIEESISTTSRPIRAGEQDWREYHFVTRDTFEEKIWNWDFLEYATVHTNLYGSTQSELDRIISSGRHPIYIIEPQGMIQIKPVLESRGYRVVTVFLLPPSIEEMQRRLKHRGTETEESFQIRLNTAIWEFTQQDLYDFKIVNDDLEKAKEELLAILQS